MIKYFTRHLFFRYAISGLTSFSVNLGVLSFLYYLFHLYYIYASIVSFGAAFFVSLVLQKFWTFKDRNVEKVHLQIGKYLATSLFGLAINTLLLYILVDYFHAYVFLGQIFAGGITAFFTFFIFRDYVFNQISPELDLDNKN